MAKLTEEERTEKLEKEAEEPADQPTEEEDKYLQQVYERFKAMRDAQSRQDAQTRWDDGDKAYEAYVASLDEDDYRTNINKPIAFAIIETELQETIDRKPRPKVDPREAGDKNQVHLINATMKYSFDVGDFDYEYQRAKKESKIRGTGWVVEYYREDSRMVNSPKKFTKNEKGEIEEKYTLERKIDFDDCYAEYKPNEVIFTDPSANHIKKARDGILREILDIDEFRRVYEGKRGFENTEDVSFGGDTSWPSFYDRPQDMTDKEVEVLHYYNRSKDQYIVVANGVCIRKGPIPYSHKEIPFIPIYRYKKPNEFYGYGIPWIIRSLVDERNTLSNLRLDYQKMGLQKMFFYDEMIDLDEEDLITRPMGGIPVNPQGKSIDQVIRWIEYGDVKPSTYREEEILLDDIRRATGIDDRVQGLNVGGTATEAAILKESSMKRINACEIMDEMDSLVRLGRLRLSNIRFFYPIPKIQKITMSGDKEIAQKKYRQIRIDGREFSIDEKGNLDINNIDGYSFFEINNQTKGLLDLEVDIKVEASTTADIPKSQKQKNITEMFDRLTANPIILNQLNPRSSVQRYIEIMDEASDTWIKKGPSDEVDMQMQAEQENVVMSAGHPIPPTPGADEAHTLVHLTFAKTSIYEQLPPEIQGVFEAHIVGEGSKMMVPGTPGGDGMVESPNMASQMAPPAQGMQQVAPDVAGTSPKTNQNL